MLGFFEKKPVLGLEITSRMVRVAVITGSGASAEALAAEAVPLPAGVVEEGYATPNVRDTSALAEALRECLDRVASFGARRAALSLPDSVFRVQMLDFDELPAKGRDRDRLIRWRLEKAAAFDTTGTMLRYQSYRRNGKGYSLLACSAKQEVISQYESLVTDIGIQPWTLGLTSFHAMNYYGPSLPGAPKTFAFAYIADDSFSTIVADAASVYFYRWKEMKRAASDASRARVVREISDSVHFYTHMDRSQQPDVEGLFIAGEAEGLEAYGDGLRSSLPMDITVLTRTSGTDAGDIPVPAASAASLGAGGAV